MAGYLRYGPLVVRERKDNETNQYDTGNYETQKGTDKPRRSPLLPFGGVGDAKDIDEDPGYELERIHAEVSTIKNVVRIRDRSNDGN